MDEDYWEAMIDKGQWREFGEDTGDTSLLFYEKCHGIFNDYRESGPWFNVSFERQILFNDKDFNTDFTLKIAVRFFILFTILV